MSFTYRTFAGTGMTTSKTSQVVNNCSVVDGDLLILVCGFGANPGSWTAGYNPVTNYGFTEILTNGTNTPATKVYAKIADGEATSWDLRWGNANLASFWAIAYDGDWDTADWKDTTSAHFEYGATQDPTYTLDSIDPVGTSDALFVVVSLSASGQPVYPGNITSNPTGMTADVANDCGNSVTFKRKCYCFSQQLASGNATGTKSVAITASTGSTFGSSAVMFSIKQVVASTFTYPEIERRMPRGMNRGKW